jgi:hypothetical protein
LNRSWSPLDWSRSLPSWTDACTQRSSGWTEWCRFEWACPVTQQTDRSPK